ncbi:MAG TPA: glycosyltransferase [Sporichthya sp.]|nr:glycosyltransferase [Sporichthya sp.]
MSGRPAPRAVKLTVSRALQRLRGRSDSAPAPTEAPPRAAAEVDPEADIALNATIPWADLSARPRDAGTVSVIVPTYRDIEMTTTAVAAVARDAETSSRRVQVIVVDNGCAPKVAAQLDALAEAYPGTEVTHNAVNHGFALGNNLALPLVAGEVVVFLNNDTEAAPGWLDPLVRALDDPGVVGAQSLLVFPTGTIQSAGIAFPAGGGVPHPLLVGHPVEDAEGLRGARLQAATAAALAMRTADVIALRGFDPWFRNGMEDADLGLRAGRDLGGHFVLCPDSVVVHHESQTPGRYRHAMRNRRQFLDRWQGSVTGDDEELWRRAGFEVVGHERKSAPTDDQELWVPLPVVRRIPSN